MTLFSLLAGAPIVFTIEWIDIGMPSSFRARYTHATKNNL